MIDYINLGRRFIHLGNQEISEDIVYESYSLLDDDREAGLAWDEIIKEKLVVILGEPGSGKSTEFKEQVNKLKINGTYAFYIRLDDLITKSLKENLKTQLVYFLKWQKSKTEAYFFLDSVDESKLSKTTDFEKAIENFRASLTDNELGRSYIFLSSRISEWRTDADVQIVNHLLTKIEEKQVATTGRNYEKPTFPVLKMLPLSKNKVRIFARESGSSNPDLFIDAIDNSHSLEFARRPIDVIDLLNYWKVNNRIGSLTEIMEFNISRNLKETPERAAHETLSYEHARQGAETLAATVVFCRNLNINVPDNARLLDSSSIDSSACLPDNFSDNERKRLFNRPIFDSASYGKIRFHHRRIAEYLAACWLKNRIVDGCPFYTIKELLFESNYDQVIIKPSLAPVTAWLCSIKDIWCSSQIREMVLKSSPQIHLQNGDPGALPNDYKKEVLRAIVKRYENRKIIRLDTDIPSMSRFAVPELTDEISTIFSDKTVTEDIRTEMLRLVSHGKLTGCIDSALALIDNPDESDNVKGYAVAAIRDIGNTEQKNRLLNIVSSWSKIPSSLFWLLFDALFPDGIGKDKLKELFKKLDISSGRGDNHVIYIKSHIEKTLTPEWSYDLLSIFIELIQTTTTLKDGDKQTPISIQYRWIGKLIPFVLLTLFKKGELSSDEIELSVNSLKLFDWISDLCSSNINEIDLLPDAIDQHPSLKTSLFKSRFNKWKEKYGQDIDKWTNILHYKPEVYPKTQDLDWLLDIIRYSEDIVERKIAFLFSNEIWISNYCSIQTYRKVKRAIGNKDKDLIDLFKRYTSHSLVRWVKRNTYYRLPNNYRWAFQKLKYPWWWKKQSVNIIKYFQHKKNQIILLISVLSIVAGKNKDLLYWLLNETHYSTSNNKEDKKSEWELIRKRHSMLISWAARKGCKSAWRDYLPVLPHENQHPNTINRDVDIGLAGIQACIEDGEIKFDNLSKDDEGRLIRYAINDLRDFSPWLKELVKIDEDSVVDILNECIRNEWITNSDNYFGYKIIRDLFYNNDEIFFSLCRNQILELLIVSDLQYYDLLKGIMAKLFKMGNPSILAIISRIAPTRIKSYNVEDKCFTLWMSIWLQLDASNAISFLYKTLSCAGLKADQIMINLCSSLLRDFPKNYPLLKNPDYENPLFMQEFIILVHKHVRPQDDIYHQGSYTPSGRDHAQRFRDDLLNKLSYSEDRTSIAVLKELLTLPEFSSNIDWIKILIDRTIEKHAELSPWNPIDIKIFEKEFEIDPRTDHDLFKIICWRLDELKNDVECGEMPMRKEVHKEDHETILRTWFARKLKERSHNRYTDPQESVTDGEKEIDIKIENPKTDPIIIELKKAENWYYNELVERLNNQLVGQYLRPSNCRYGIYLLGLTDKNNAKCLKKEKQEITFMELVEDLKVEAKQIVDSRDDINDIKVIGIDFTVPDL
jgi:hypothetical protein